MRIAKALLTIALCCSVPVAGHAQTSGRDIPFAGCYRVVSQIWHPMNEDASPIPGRFQLSAEPAVESRWDFFSMRSLPASGNPNEKLWVWRPKGDRLWLSWGTGLGGFRGTLKRSGRGELVGKVKEWCDYRCGWKIRAATIRIAKIDCSK